MKFDDPSSCQQLSWFRIWQLGLPAAQFHLASTSALAIDAATESPFLYIGLESTAQPRSFGRSAVVIHMRGWVVNGSAFATRAAKTRPMASAIPTATLAVHDATIKLGVARAVIPSLEFCSCFDVAAPLRAGLRSIMVPLRQIRIGPRP